MIDKRYYAKRRVAFCYKITKKLGITKQKVQRLTCMTRKPKYVFSLLVIAWICVLLFWHYSVKTSGWEEAVRARQLIRQNTLQFRSVWQL